MKSTMDHNTVTHYLTMYGWKVSHLTTVRGLLNYVRRHPRSVQVNVSRPVPPSGHYRSTGYYEWTPRARKWTDTERQALRIKHDPRYRREITRQLRRESTVSARSYTPERMDSARDACIRAGRLGIELKPIVAKVYTVQVELSDLPYSPGGKDATAIATLNVPGRARLAGETEWKNGRAVGYTRTRDDSYVLSACRLNKNGVSLDYWYQSPESTREHYQLVCPAGYRWDRDAMGLKLMHGPDDYHPTCRELRGSILRVISALGKNAEIRRKLAAERAMDRAEAEGVYVCLADSLAGGNCRAGSEAWAAKHKIDISSHMPAGLLFDRANGDWGRVRLAIRAALTRTHREKDLGYCELNQHKVA